jgi:hypothetical protein
MTGTVLKFGYTVYQERQASCQSVSRRVTGVQTRDIILRTRRDDDNKINCAGTSTMTMTNSKIAVVLDTDLLPCRYNVTQSSYSCGSIKLHHCEDCMIEVKL